MVEAAAAAAVIPEESRCEDEAAVSQTHAFRQTSGTA